MKPFVFFTSRGKVPGNRLGRATASGLALVLLLALGGGCRSSLLAPAAPPEMTVVSDQWPPYSLAEGADQPGFTVELLRAIYEPQGIKVKYLVVPFEAALRGVERGRYDVFLNGGVRDLAGCLVPAEPCARIHFTAFVRKGSAWRYAGPESLRGRRVGLVRGYQYDQGGPLDGWFKANPGGLRMASGRTPLATLQRRLAQGEVEVVIEDALAFAWAARSRGGQELFQAAGMVGSLDLFIGFSPAETTSQVRSRIYDQGVRDLRQNGQLARLLARYGMADWRPGESAPGR